MIKAKIVDAKKEFSLPDNASYLDVRFELVDEKGKVVAERRHAFPIGTTKEAIVAELSAYCRMFENDHALAAEAGKRAESEAEADKVLDALKDTEISADAGDSEKE